MIFIIAGAYILGSLVGTALVTKNWVDFCAGAFHVSVFAFIAWLSL